MELDEKALAQWQQGSDVSQEQSKPLTSNLEGESTEKKTLEDMVVCVWWAL